MRCRVCESEDEHPVVVATEMMYGSGDKHRYFSCLGCGCVQIEHMPESMERYYGGAYYSFQPVPQKRLIRHAIVLRNRFAVLRRGFIGRALFRLKPTTLFDFLGPAAVTLDSSILDVGCGAGGLVRTMRMAGFRGARGVDPFVSEDILLDGAPLVTRATLDQTVGQFDLIMFHHSLEHMPDQLGTLRDARERLQPGGWCIVRVPLASSLAWERYGVDWVQLDAPRHFYLHTPSSMQRVAAQAGFECRAVIFDSTAFQFWGSEQYAQGITLHDKRSYAVDPAASPFSVEDLRRFEDDAVALNAIERGDQAAFVFRKIS